VDEIDVLIECSAEPSVLAGYHDSPRYVVEANLGGAVNCFELARRRRAALIFLSTSRVYPIAPVNAIAVEETDTRFEIAERQALPGVSAKGISESFGLNGARSLYGATKLAAELVLHEYGDMYGLRYVINRLGVITGPGQMGKVDQGVFALWMARHYFRMPLVYKGWGGTGKQVRDLVHVDDVWNLVGAQLGVWEQIDRKTYNVGGGRAVSLSLREATALCQEITGNRVALDSSSDTHPSDVRAYLTDHSHVTNELGWIPTRDARTTLADIYDWIKSDEHRLAPIFKS
jgi:CDP-paratose 2-epimerase